VRSRYLAAGGVVLHKGKVLVLLRPSRSEVRLPKGHVRRHEDALAAAVREVREESGYADLRPMADLGELTVAFEFEGRHLVRRARYFLMALDGPASAERPPKDKEQFQVSWLEPDGAARLLTFEAEREWLRRALAAAGDAERQDAAVS
jgi:8-oxo-dGTP pyrophosphatase MutT (NUDIX family)